MPFSPLRSSLCGVVAVVAMSCGASEEEVQREFDAIVAASNSCELASECVTVSPGCPLGCFVAVNAKFESRVAARARELIDDYEAGGAACDYGCAIVGALACIENKCDYAPLDADSRAGD